MMTGLERDERLHKPVFAELGLTQPFRITSVKLMGNP